jgi:flagellar biosynthetic protein FliQ
VNTTLVLDLGRELLVLALLISLPMLATAIVVGLVIAIFQAVTAVHEQTLSTVPKMIAVLAVALLIMPWAMGKVVFFTQNVLRDLPRYASQR